MNESASPQPFITQHNSVLRGTCRIFSDIASEAFSALGSKVLRTALTVSGAAVGTAALVAALGLTSSARAAVSQSFNRLAATQLVIGDTTPSVSPPAFNSSTGQTLRRLPGVTGAGVLWQMNVHLSLLSPWINGSISAIQLSSVNVLAASPGVFRAVGAHFVSGNGYGVFDQRRNEPVAVVGANAASTLGLSPQNLGSGQSVILDGVPFTIVGIFNGAGGEPEMLSSVIIPSNTGSAFWGPPISGAQVDITVKPGAAQVVANEVPLALMPADPTRLSVLTNVAPLAIQGTINNDLGGLFGIIGVVATAVAVIGIASTMLVSVIERTYEIGLRRALGARKSHIACQFVLESTIIGLLGGLLGTMLGIIIVAVLANANHWLAVIEPSLILPDPLIGGLTGLVAGIYPALRAASKSPVEALRR